MTPVFARLAKENIGIKQIFPKQWAIQFLSEKKKNLGEADRVIIVGTHTKQSPINLVMVKELYIELAGLIEFNKIFLFVVRSNEVSLPSKCFELVDWDHLLVTTLENGSETEIFPKFDFSSFLKTLGSSEKKIKK
jgi:hypothetical protein